MFGGLNSFVDMQVGKRKVTALRSFEALQATARLSGDKRYGSMYILCDAEDWIGLEAFNGSGILNVDEDANYAEMSMSIIEIHKEESGENEEWLHVSSSVDVTSEGDAHSLSAHALVRVDGDEQMSMSTAAGYDDGGADMDMTVAWDQEEYLRSVAHVRSTDAEEDATAVEMAAALRVDAKQVFDMVGNGTWHEDEGAAMVLTVEGDDEDEEWLHVSSSVDVTSEGDAHSLSAHALVRVDGDEQMSMSTAAGYDDGGADMNMTVAWDQEEYLRSVAHVRSTDAGDDATAVEMAALLRVDDKQVFDMVGNGTWHEDEGAAMVLTVEGDDEDEEWLHVSSSVDVTSEGDAHSLSAHALVRVDGDEQMSMSTAAGYDDGGADMDMTVAWDQEEYLRSVAHVRSTDVGDDATAVEMAALLRVDDKQLVFTDLDTEQGETFASALALLNISREEYERSCALPNPLARRTSDMSALAFLAFLIRKHPPVEWSRGECPLAVTRAPSLGECLVVVVEATLAKGKTPLEPTREIKGEERMLLLVVAVAARDVVTVFLRLPEQL
ncbi:hypothetical protein CYMTET_14835 [Cymbomonas tetramitiformis]|uniref:Uncharacterized protein n=1 Tax=Cymbomonas tetramitiformis TaxID=36881 RepID=A0AAE0GF84_9CHLO|nr:hypothetical protein CYMTET_14835 [Cymbomonas tetramitiformis]